MVTVHWVPFTESHPLHPVKVEPVEAEAVISTIVPLSNVPLHVLPVQVTPGVALDRVPLPVPDVPAVRAY